LAKQSSTAAGDSCSLAGEVRGRIGAARNEEWTVNFWGWLIVLGSVGSSVGFTLYGMGTSTLQPDRQLIDIGKILLFGGLIILAIGFFAFKATDRSETT
jgi:hypothetical protein